MPQRVLRTRRRFLKDAAAAGAGLLGAGVFGERARRPPRWSIEKLNVAAIGVGGRGAAELRQVSHENIVALCDVDARKLAAALERHPKAEPYHDFRLMYEMEAHRIDAVIVSTPDHVHAPAGLAAMRLGKHLYCQKPLTCTVREARLMRETARERGVATQMGIQIHARENYHRVVEIVRSGAIGAVREVHVWCSKAWGGGERPRKAEEPPTHLKWDLWLGPAPDRPYASGRYHPAEWRRWWDFGSGTLGDMACHLMDLPFWALELGAPRTVAAEGPPAHPETAPLGLVVRWVFPHGIGRDIRLTWYDGDRTPRRVAGHDVPGMGVMFVGEEGELFADYDGYRLHPEKRFKGWEPPPKTLARSIGHWKEWTTACRGEGTTSTGFDYSGPLTEAVLLGNAAFRSGRTITWDADALAAVDAPGADRFLTRSYREGWAL